MAINPAMAASIIDNTFKVVAQDRGDPDWGGHGLSTQWTKTEKQGSDAYFAGTLNSFFTGETGKITMPLKVNKGSLFLTAGIVLIYLFFK